ncbi:MAG TPA: Gfo/Idh/MocA family oxidoreductase [Planctomycetota bacterium]|nr:Gfo/Idh/MocA family oxidoreductase [Planctomycetota bacterium]
MQRPNPEPTPIPSRRDVIAGAAAVAGLITAACASDRSIASLGPLGRGQPHKPIAPHETIRIGVIGTGGMGTGHCEAIAGLAKAGKEKVQIAAVSDVCKPRLEAARKLCAEKQAIAVDGYRSYHDLLSRDDLHGVLIASPEHWHAQMAIDAMQAGKDVYVEKPMTLRMDDALRLRRVAMASDKVLQVGTQFLTHRKYHEARKLIEADEIGQPTMIQTSYCRNSKEGEWLYGIDPEVEPGEMLDWEGWCGPLGPQRWDTEVYHRWRRYRSYSTGIIGDLLVHVMTPLVFALDCGWPVRVLATGAHYADPAMENHDQVNLTVQFERPCTLLVAGSTCNELGLETLIRGHRANLYLGSKDCVLKPERVFAEEIDEKKVECPSLSDQDEHRLDWLACMRTRAKPLGDVDLAARIMVIVDLATRSIWEGRAMTFDPLALRASPA